MPFDSSLKRMTVVYKHAYAENQSRLLFLCKGAMESVIECCTEFLDENGNNLPITQGEIFIHQLSKTDLIFDLRLEKCGA
jgi:magnesium-transporting ATPase (P-type)